MKKETPMGYSAWIRYGKKFGYYDYAHDIIHAKIDEEWCHKILSHSAKIPKAVVSKLIK